VVGNNSSRFTGDGRLPVEQVSWDDCQEFIRKLNSKGEGTFRLPTEAEWECSCRAGTTTIYYFGDEESRFGDYGWHNENSEGKTHLVGGKQPNPWGLYDMHGNVWEWCQDWYGDYPSGEEIDPTGPSSGLFRVFRGGSWNDSLEYCRSVDRYRYTPEHRNSLLGFRLAFLSAGIQNIPISHRDSVAYLEALQAEYLLETVRVLTPFDTAIRKGE